MTPDRIKLFLRCFYQSYVLHCYNGYELEHLNKKELALKLENYDVIGYFIKNLDIYVENCDFMKEYTLLYNPILFEKHKENSPELFNDLQIFLIENIQLFLHTILEAAINTHVLKESKISGLKLYVKAIENKEIRLLDLIDEAEASMKKLNVSPPAMG